MVKINTKDLINNLEDIIRLLNSSNKNILGFNDDYEYEMYKDESTCDIIDKISSIFQDFDIKEIEIDDDSILAGNGPLIYKIDENIDNIESNLKLMKCTSYELIRHQNTPIHKSLIKRFYKLKSDIYDELDMLENYINDQITERKNYTYNNVD